ncbi:MAG TPA: amino acid ABC transporter permease, partial [Rhodobacteraceae bacterium]|nr:amino acid ABC transporter permease [Paracoccaceae bacterium]
MAMADQPAGKSFRLSMLLYDTRYRSITIQVIMLLGFIASVVWLLDNMYTNLAKADKDPDFAFLSSSAGYDINQRLIEYTSQSTHARAWLVGLLNTLLVAFLGCILATVLGVSVGVMRLSKNWIVSRLMTVYVES